LHFKGKKDKSEVREEMSHNWLYISAASSDGSSISLLEAMAAGMICIVSDFPSNLEWVENHFNGFTFKNGDASDLARTIQVVAKLEVEKKTSIGKRAQEIISARGDWETNRLKFIAAVTELSR
jgi:glycosyltransferase involved in cell wall biosynthesis